MRDGYYAKYDLAGNYLWAKRVGGSADAERACIQICTDGTSVFVGTQFAGVTNFSGTIFTSYGYIAAPHVPDLAICRYEAADGNFGSVGWAKHFASVSNKELNGLTVYAGGVVACGAFSGTVGFSGTNKTADNYDGFVAVLNSFGGLNGLYTIGATSQHCEVYDVASNSTGSLYYCGSFTGTVDANPGTGSNPITALGSFGFSDGFVACLNSGTTFQWAARYAGSSNNDRCSAVGVDNAGNALVAGTVLSSSFTVNNTASTMRGGPNFLGKLSVAGNPVWTTTTQGTDQPDHTGLVAAPDGKLVFSTLHSAAPFIDFNGARVATTGFYLSRYEE